MLTESCDKATELAIVDMLRYSLEHADRNLPVKEWVPRKVCSFWQDLPSVVVTVLFWVICFVVFF